MVTKWVGGHYMLGFAPALRFLRSQILCRLYKNHSDEAISRGHLHVYAWKMITHACLRSCSTRLSLVDYGNIKITQHALKVPEPSECWSWMFCGRRRRRKAFIVKMPSSHAKRRESGKLDCNARTSPCVHLLSEPDLRSVLSIFRCSCWLSAIHSG